MSPSPTNPIDIVRRIAELVRENEALRLQIAVEVEARNKAKDELHRRKVALEEGKRRNEMLRRKSAELGEIIEEMERRKMMGMVPWGGWSTLYLYVEIYRLSTKTDEFSAPVAGVIMTRGSHDCPLEVTEAFHPPVALKPLPDTLDFVEAPFEASSIVPMYQPVMSAFLTRYDTQR